MNGQQAQIALVVWRESVEALLVIGILDAWLRNVDTATRHRGRRALWAGVVAGIFLAVLLAVFLLLVGSALDGDGEAYFRIAMVFTAAALIVQAVLWMRANSASLRQTLDARMKDGLRAANWFGVFLLASIAIAREGSETAVFLYGILAASGGASASVSLAPTIGLGLAGAAATYAALTLGSYLISWRLFFNASAVMLLLLAGALVVTGVSDLIGLDILPTLSGPLWDASPFLDDRGTIGGLIAELTGYRARPEAMIIIVHGAYWVLVLWTLFRSTARRHAHGTGTAAT